MRSSPMENDNGDGLMLMDGGAVSAGIVGPKCNVGVPVSGLMATLTTSLGSRIAFSVLHVYALASFGGVSGSRALIHIDVGATALIISIISDIFENEVIFISGSIRQFAI